jgi:tRNA dimethylallyltransferase
VAELTSPAAPELPFTVAVVGPTATGKSDLAVALALALGGEVVNADAMQLYRGMDVGTAKLTPAERRGVPHHLLDVLDVRQEASVATYQRAARAALVAIAGRGRVPVLCGGSGLYVRAVLEDLAIPPTDPSVRARLEGELAAAGAPALHARLAGLDPVAAANILPGNGRRIVRALEVVELTGRPFSATMPAPGAAPAVPSVQVGLLSSRPDLDARIDARVDRMWAAGLVAETRALEVAGLREGRTASRALGYAQVLRLLAGELDETAAKADTRAATRKFARRQDTWFRRFPAIRWLAADAPDLRDQALAAVAAARAGRP